MMDHVRVLRQWLADDQSDPAAAWRSAVTLPSLLATRAFVIYSEALTKETGDAILMTEATRRALSTPRPRSSKRGQFEVRGKASRVTLHAVSPFRRAVRLRRASQPLAPLESGSAAVRSRADPSDSG
jgi:hypothetical protein